MHRMTKLSFRASARTIDHLGKGQIADTPTAVSELWKNAYDAYARNVALHTFDGPIKCGAVIDNGCGMTPEQITGSWLVIGTNAKTNKETLSEEDRFGLDIRFTQGEKGIGRLSAAFLAPITLLVTKKINTEFTAVLIDWRLFENPYLSISDISVPYTSFRNLNELSSKISILLSELKENLCLKPDEIEDESSKLLAKRIRKAWELFSQDEINFATENNEVDFVTTQEKIESFCDTFKFNEKITETWGILLNESIERDGSSHGTALFLLDLNRELSLLTNREDKAVDDFEVISIRESLVDTLKAFVDPFKQDQFDFHYEIKAFGYNWEPNVILQGFDIFGYEEFCALEHKVEGYIDEKGWLIANITVFGKSIGEVRYPPSISFDGGITKVGKFEIRLGAYEQKGMTSLEEHEIDELKKKFDKDHGVLIFRDGLRVLPYGRVDNDFFAIEERRGLNAGRYFWANRRMIGHISLTQNNNNKLKDKAGREGFIKNQAARELREIVIDHLNTLAFKHFGRESDTRKVLLEIAKKEREARKDAQNKAKKQTQKSFKQSLTTQRPILDKKIEFARKIYKEISENLDNSIIQLDKYLDVTVELEKMRGELRTPTKPSKLGQKLEDDYREYRDLYNEFTELIRVCQEKLNALEAKNSALSPMEIGKKSFDSKQALLNSQVSKYEKLISSKLERLDFEWGSDASSDRSKFHTEAIGVLEQINSVEHLETQLNVLDAIYVNLADSFTVKYESILRALERLEQGINLDSAFSMAEEEKAYFEDKAKKLQALAQLGISVEVMSHELEQQDQLVTRGLNSLPAEVKSHPGYTTAYNAHKQLTSHIRFLSPLKLSGYQARQDITGIMIQNHIEKFFRNRFERQRVEISMSDKFRRLVLRDLPSRIYPVFVNLINNAMYWVCLSEIRKIAIEIIDEKVVIGNSGPAIDEDDIPLVFDLFYSRRTNGHGVGLYLCKENLAVAHHKIWYAESSDEKIFPTGANFVIEFNGVDFK